MRGRVLLLLVLGVLLFSDGVAVRPEPAAACSCAVQTASQQFDRADAVFAGQLTQIIPPEDRGSSGAEQTLRFTVERVYKGEVGRVVEVHTAQSSASCGLGVSALGPYVIFASGHGISFTSGSCSGSVGGAAPASFDDGGPPNGSVSPHPPTSQVAPDPPPATSPVGWWLLGAAAAVVALVLVRWRRSRQR